MKMLISYLALSLFLMASQLPNTGLKQNNLGYYGEGVTFGSIPIIGPWNICVRTSDTVFGINGTISGSSSLSPYGVSEDGEKMYIQTDAYWENYTIINKGNNGCLYLNIERGSMLFGSVNYYKCNVCNKSVNSKTYGPNSNTVDITVGTD